MALSQLLPPAGPLRRYSVISLVAAVGTGMYVTGSAAFFIRYAGLDPLEVGAGLTVAGLLGLLASVPAGMLGDRYGHRRVLIALHLIRAVAFGLYTVATSFPLFFGLVSIIALADAAENANRRAYLSAISSAEDRVKANAFNRTFFNIGFAAGSAAAGIVLAVNQPSLYVAFTLGNAVSYTVAAVVMSRLPDPAAPIAAPVLQRRNALLNLPFMTMSLLAGVLYLHQSLMNVGLPLWVLERTNAPSWLLAVLMVTNTALVIVLQVPLSNGGETAHGAARLSLRAAVVLAGGCVLWGLSSGRSLGWTVVLLLGGMLLITLGEIYCSVVSWGLSYALAPEQAQGEYLGAWSMGVQFVLAIGPVLFAAPLLNLGLVGWLGIGTVFVATGMLIVPMTRWAQERMAVRELVGSNKV